jgi:hypothetical protein
LVLRNQAKNEYHYKKTGAINLTVMAKRLNNQSTVGDVLKQIIQVNKLQSGMDQIDVKDAWCNLMGNGVNSYTKNVVLKDAICGVKLFCITRRVKPWEN